MATDCLDGMVHVDLLVLDYLFDGYVGCTVDSDA